MQGIDSSLANRLLSKSWRTARYKNDISTAQPLEEERLMCRNPKVRFAAKGLASHARVRHVKAAYQGESCLPRNGNQWGWNLPPRLLVARLFLVKKEDHVSLDRDLPPGPFRDRRVL